MNNCIDIFLIKLVMVVNVAVTQLLGMWWLDSEIKFNCGYI